MKLFIDQLITQIKQKHTPCIVGLDSELDRMPDRWLKEQGINQQSSLNDCTEAIYQYNLLVLDALPSLLLLLRNGIICITPGDRHL